MESTTLFEQLNSILVEQKRPDEAIEKIKSAFDFASRLHKGQYRVSEEPYIVHPVEVSCILANLEADTDTIIASLLHDILEDTETKPEEIEKLYGKDVLTLVNGVTKLSKFSFSSKEERQAENFRKMFLAMAEDVRVILLKLADRLHNMRTLNYMVPHKQKKIAEETLEIFAPLANRLGMNRIKIELEDLSLRYINPEKYFEIAQLVSLSKAERDQTVQAIIHRVQSSLKTLDINATITGRAKNFYSIFFKMQRKQKSYNDLYDINAIRIIVDDEKECYEVLGVIHSAFKPIPGRFKDFIAMPKSNLYRSLHTSVIGPRGKPVEVQIRTREMHEIAEYGVAAHWKYKESSMPITSKASDESKFSWLRKLVEFQNDIKDAKEYVDSVKLDLFSDQVFVFTPKGEVLDLPNGATPIDFAYRIHSEIGHKCSGALVNGRIVPLDTKLRNGDIIEILTNKNSKPRLDWINIVATNQTRSKIRHWFKKNLKEDNGKKGHVALEHELGKSVFDEHFKSGKLTEVAKQLNYQNEHDLFCALGHGELTLNKVANRLKAVESVDNMPKIKPHKPSVSNKSNKVIEGLEGMLYHISKCCTPVPGEPIIGVITRSRGVSVHREDCNNLALADKERLMFINWSGVDTSKTFVTYIQVEVIDRLGVLKDILTKIADNKTNINHANFKNISKSRALVEIGLEIKDIDHLVKIQNSILNISDVLSVKRQKPSVASKLK